MRDEPFRECPKELCRLPKWGHGKVKRLLGTGAGLIFKGSGFYITDYPGIKYLFSANGASIIPAWGTAPGIQITVQTSAESASQSDGRIKVVADENRAFSAGFFWPINPGALPQARGEHVAPLALNT